MTRPRYSGPNSWFFILIFKDIKILGNISVLVTFQLWWHFSFIDNSVLVNVQIWWHFSFGNISVFMTYQFLWHLLFFFIWVLMIFHFWWHFSHCWISVFGKLQFWWFFSFDLDPTIWTPLFRSVSLTQFYEPIFLDPYFFTCLIGPIYFEPSI